MRTRKRRIPPNRIWLVILLGISLIGLTLPRRWTGGLISLVQVFVPFQDAVEVTADSAAAALADRGEPPTSEILETIRRDKAALEHHVASLTIRVAELEEEVSILTATRLWGDDYRIGARGRLIPAKVVTADLLPWRTSRLINAGSLQGVRPGAAVLSRFFSVDRGQEDGIRNGMAVLLAEALVGDVDQVGTHTARVKLLSDVSVERKVRIARRTDSGFEPVDGFFWLTGRGQGIMEIREVDRRDVDSGVIQTGDLVLSDHTNQMLPASLVIGEIQAIKPDRHNPLLSILTIVSATDEAKLRRVYVFDPAADP